MNVTPDTVPHILQLSTASVLPSPTLKFTRSIHTETGEPSAIPALQPENWDHVAHLARNMFYAWDDAQPANGCLYRGEWVNE